FSFRMQHQWYPSQDREYTRMISTCCTCYYSVLLHQYVVLVQRNDSYTQMTLAKAGIDDFCLRESKPCKSKILYWSLLELNHSNCSAIQTKNSPSRLALPYPFNYRQKGTNRMELCS